MEVVMNSKREDEIIRRNKKIKRRQKLFRDMRPFRSTKSGKVRCGIKGCFHEAIKVKGKIPVCGQH